MEIAALRAENTRLKQIISHFIAGRNEEASTLLDLRHGLFGGDEPAILEGRVVPSTTHERELPKHRDKRAKLSKGCGDAEVTHLKPLSSMTLQEVLQIWNEEWTHSNKAHRPLRQIVEAPNSEYKKKWFNKGIAEQVKRIRFIVLLVELLPLHEIQDPISTIERIIRSNNWSMDALGRRIQDDLRILKVSTSGKITTASDVFNHQNYDSTKCFWSSFI